jgi:hypothetical protein
VKKSPSSVKWEEQQAAEALALCSRPFSQPIVRRQLASIVSQPVKVAYPQIYHQQQELIHQQQELIHQQQELIQLRQVNSINELFMN